MVRRDLPLGVLAAQLTHAAGESSPGHLPAGTLAVVLAVPGEAELRALSARLDASGVAHVKVEEDAPPYAGALMALGFPPVRKEALRRHLSSLPLLR